MESIFLYCIICLLAGIPAILRPASSLTASQAYVRVPEGERIVSGQQPGANDPVIQKKLQTDRTQRRFTSPPLPV